MKRYWGQPQEQESSKRATILELIGEGLLFTMMVVAVLAIPVSILFHYLA